MTMAGNSKKSEWISWAKSIALALVIAFICRQFIFAPVTVQGESMMPTFQDQNKVIVTKLSKIERLDVVVFHSPDSEDDYIKRVIGLPGDEISVKDDQLFVNGKKVDEPYLAENRKEAAEFGIEHLTENFGPLVVPEHQYFVMGDNRLNSNDSRSFGFISDESVVGEAKFRYFPLNRIGNPEKP
ncbi:signal peptidase I [Bacillus infantis]|jgi:signal peptidase I|uniref:signal peptidase I n=1 Tax=Bacillus infantis TaxID=324767 RepID=UPI00345026D0